MALRKVNIGVCKVGVGIWVYFCGLQNHFAVFNLRYHLYVVGVPADNVLPERKDVAFGHLKSSKNVVGGDADQKITL